MSKQLYIAPVSPWAVNETELERRRNAVREAEAALRHAQSRRAPATERMRLEQSLVSARRELDSAERELQLERRRQQVGNRAAAVRREAVGSTPARAASAANSGRQFAPPVPYWEQPKKDATPTEDEQRMVIHKTPAKPTKAARNKDAAPSSEDAAANYLRGQLLLMSEEARKQFLAICPGLV